MSNNKALLDAACAEPSELVKLSNDYGQTTSQLPSGVEAQIRSIIPSSMATNLVQDYLERASERAQKPDTFDMRTILGQISSNSGGQNEEMERSWELARVTQRNPAIMAQNWTNEFLKQERDSSAKNLTSSAEWVKQFESAAGDGSNYLAGMEDAWTEGRQVVTRNPSMWASDFLDKFDQVNSNDELPDKWMNEFVNGVQQLHVNNGTDENEMFYDYDEWDNGMNAPPTQELYQFNQTNPYLNEQNLTDKAREMFSRGRISDAILYYEAALKQNSADVETWIKLGLCHAENEQDPMAILALKSALKIEPSNREALLSLAVSLANEQQESVALCQLDKWISVYNNENISAESTEDQKPPMFSFLSVDEFARVEAKFLKTVRERQQDGQVVSELQNALSILYNLNAQYDRAVDCIRAALSINPSDPILWNRLGATLANADRSTEAINAYREALRMFPAYVRARYNLGIACMNLNSYSDAVAHFLGALQMQNTPETSQIWSKLRSSIIRTEIPGPTEEVMNSLNTRNIQNLLRIHNFQNS